MEVKQSFTQKVKEELALLEYENSFNNIALLSGFTSVNGRFLINNRNYIILLTTENAKVAKLIYRLYQKEFNVNPRLTYSRRMKFDKKVCFNILIDENVDEILKKLEIEIYEVTNKSFLKKDEGCRYFLCGCFLATGSCNDPISSNYHLEISSSNENLSLLISKILTKTKDVTFHAKTIQRRSSYVVYMKKSDQIVDFLAYIGAQGSCLDFEEIRVERDFRNNDNRLQICENANVTRTVESSHKQKDDIEMIDKVLGIKNIPNEKMRILCILRLENEEASMQDLADLLSYELAGKIDTKISKSNVNHLFRAIHAMAERYRNL